MRTERTLNHSALRMAKITVKPTAKLKKKPVKAGSSNNKRGGFPTSKLILIMKDMKEKK